MACGATSNPSKKKFQQKRKTLKLDRMKLAVPWLFLNVLQLTVKTIKSHKLPLSD
jgi:hypothetical protein